MSDRPERSPRRAARTLACAVVLAVGLHGLATAGADTPTLAPQSALAVKKAAARPAASTSTAEWTDASARGPTPAWGAPAAAPAAPAAASAAGSATSARSSRSAATPQLVEPNLPFDQLTPDQQIRSLHESVRLLQTQLAAANARLAADEDHLVHHTHTYLGPHFYITTARSVLDELNSAANPGIVWMSRQITDHPTGPAVFAAP
jgi:hypothetical protein